MNMRKVNTHPMYLQVEKKEAMTATMKMMTTIVGTMVTVIMETMAAMTTTRMPHLHQKELPLRLRGL